LEDGEMIIARVSLAVFLSALLVPALTVRAGEPREPRQAEKYLHSIYYAVGRPTCFRAGKCVCDLSTRARVFQVFEELASLGVNAITYHSVYCPSGALYETKDPNLKRSPYWPAGATPVADYLAACEKFDVDAYLGVYLGQGGSPLIAQRALDDILDVLGKHPRVKAIVPPIEACYTGVNNAAFIALSRHVKEARPDLAIMDYPSAPYSPRDLQWFMRCAASGAVDIENIQFHACDDRIDDLRESRGLTLVAMGSCPGIRTIIHTHYKNGVHSPRRPTEWLAPSRAYDVAQSAIITGTPHGTSIFSFLHGFWGEQSSSPGGNALWRRLKWYEGIVGVQRMNPFYAFAENVSQVQIMIPTGTLEGGLDMVRRCWLPLAKQHIPASFFVNETNMSPNASVVIAPGFARCDRQQGLLLERFVAQGGTLIAGDGAGPVHSRYQRMVSAGPLSPHARRVLDLWDRPDVQPSDLAPAFAAALGFEKAGAIAGVTEPRHTQHRKGTVIIIPESRDWCATHLAGLVEQRLPARVRVENLPDDYVVERWRKRTAKGNVEMVVIFCIHKGAEAGNVRVALPSSKEHRTAYFFDGESAARLPVSGSATVAIPRLGDGFGIVVFGDAPYAVLRPSARTIRCQKGTTVPLAATLLNSTQGALKGKLGVETPKGWVARAEIPLDFDLRRGDAKTFEFALTIPRDVERRPHFVLFKVGDLVQRTIVFPVEGKPQVITERSGPLVVRRSRRVGPGRKPGNISGEWTAVTAGTSGDNLIDMHLPGVCFYQGEWDAPQQFQGKQCRYGEVLTAGMGGPNFWVNNPDPERDLVVRVTYFTTQLGRMQAYDGRRYHEVGDLAPAGAWQTDTWVVPRKHYSTADADYGRRHPGFNVIFQFQSASVYVHKIEVKMQD